MPDVNHTPGPWAVEPYNWDHDGGTLVRLAGRKNPTCIANVWGVFSAREPDAESVANAVLISAAPELLAVLEAALWMIEAHEGSSDENDKIFDDARAAIAKARGLK